MEDYPYLNEALANTLRRRRETLGLSKRRLAELAKLERVYIIQLERGDKRPTLNALFYLCEALGVTPQELLQEVSIEMDNLKGD